MRSAPDEVLRQRAALRSALRLRPSSGKSKTKTTNPRELVYTKLLTPPDEPAIRKARGGTQSRYFRHPFLHAGKDAATKRGLDAFLVEHHYTMAPVTLDTSDWMLASVYLRTEDKAGLVQAYLRYMDSICEYFEKRAVEVVGGDIAQILLIHANQLNADAMPDLLRLFAKRGYRIVGLAEALKDPAYKLADGYLGADGISWIHRWARAKGMTESREPGEPKWLLEEFGRMRGR